MSLKNKITIQITIVVIIVISLISFITIQNFRESQITEIKKEMTSIIHNFSLKINDKNKQINSTVESMAIQQTTGGFAKLNDSLKFLNEILKNTPDILGNYLIYKEDALPNKDNYNSKQGLNSNGRYAPYYTRENGNINLSVVQNIEGSSFYEKPKNNKETTITEPFIYKNIMMTSYVTPIIINGQFKGVAGIDFSLKSFQKSLEEFSTFKTNQFYLLSKSNKIIASTQGQEFINKKLDKFNKYQSAFAPLLKSEKTKISYNQQLDKYIAYAPIETGNWKIVMTVNKDELLASVNQAIRTLIIIAILGIVIVSGLLYWLIQNGLSPLNKLGERISAIANKGGDLTQRLEVTSNDEIGEVAKSFNDLLNSLQNLIKDIKDNIENLSAYSEELSASAQEGNATIDQTNQLIESMSANIQQISSNSQEVTSLAEESANKTEAGSQNIKNTLDSMKKISKEVNNAVSVINDLDETSEEIGEIVDLINNIAEQTNLLALNAAIEAARAGEHGQGFAVVAEEIRELAEETAKATDDISSLVKTTQNKSESGLKAIQKVETAVQEGEEIAQKTGHIFKEIDEVTEETSAHIQQTSASTQDLAENSDEIMNAAEDISSMSNEVTNSSQELAEMAQQLQSLVSKFDV